jgi:glycine/D-amino acid oxidase-like deaminating enzyme
MVRSHAFREFDRRKFLRGALTAGAFAIASRARSLAAPAAPLKAVAAGFNLQRHFAPVKVARNRVIREVVGLRPYRASGFMVSAERIGRKLLAHNYGHGGAGITLSWGTASLALDLTRDFIQAGGSSRPAARLRLRNAPRRFAVLGCGVSGLSTAFLLQRRFQDGTGLGARALFNDERLIPVRGQLEVLLPQPEIDYCYLSGRGYMFPRRDGIILGGTFDHDDWSLDPDPEQTSQILTGHSEIMKGLRQ